VSERVALPQEQVDRLARTTRLLPWVSLAGVLMVPLAMVAKLLVALVSIPASIIVVMAIAGSARVGVSMLRGANSRRLGLLLIGTGLAVLLPGTLLGVAMVHDVGEMASYLSGLLLLGFFFIIGYVLHRLDGGGPWGAMTMGTGAVGLLGVGLAVLHVGGGLTLLLMAVGLLPPLCVWWGFKQMATPVIDEA
jgi:hypothetical protein